MKIIVLGAGIIGISTAWHLRQHGHEVTVIERQPQAALETSFANAGQISVSYCEPWANKHAPLKALKWMFSSDAPLLFRPQWPLGSGWQQYRWARQFLMQCNDKAFERNVQQLVALGRYSQAALQEVVANTDIAYQRIQKGIAHYFTDQKSLDDAGNDAAMMLRYGVKRQMLNREEFLKVEPAYKNSAVPIVGGSYTASDESGDTCLFTQALAQHCATAGVEFLYQHRVMALNVHLNAINSVAAYAENTGISSQLKADAVVVACGSYSAPLLRAVGIDLPVYPGKGYSATLPLLKPDAAPQVSAIDGDKKIAITRLGNTLRIAGTIEVGGYDLALHTPLAIKRCQNLLSRIEAVLPGVADSRNPDQGGQPHFWCGLRPATPTNIPYIGRTKLDKLWVNTGHGTLGWTHGAGSGKLLAALMSGHKPELNFNCYGFTD